MDVGDKPTYLKPEVLSSTSMLVVSCIPTKSSGTERFLFLKAATKTCGSHKSWSTNFTTYFS
jgi:hypothetical protein